MENTGWLLLALLMGVGGIFGPQNSTKFERLTAWVPRGFTRMQKYFEQRDDSLNWLLTLPVLRMFLQGCQWADYQKSDWIKGIVRLSLAFYFGLIVVVLLLLVLFISLPIFLASPLFILSIELLLRRLRGKPLFSIPTGLQTVSPLEVNDEASTSSGASDPSRVNVSEATALAPYPREDGALSPLEGVSEDQKASPSKE